MSSDEIMADLTARANRLAREMGTDAAWKPGESDITPAEYVGAEVELNGDRYVVMDAATSRAKVWGRVTWDSRKPTLVVRTSGSYAMVRSDAAPMMASYHGYLCALRPA